jgi:hypothetical protein
MGQDLGVPIAPILVPGERVMRRPSIALVWLAGLAFALGAAACRLEGAEAVGVVSHVKILSDKVPDVSSLEAWKRSCLKEGMSDQKKALAIWETVVRFQQQDAPPLEYLHHENTVLDPRAVRIGLLAGLRGERPAPAGRWSGTRAFSGTPSARSISASTPITGSRTAGSGR